MTADILFPNVEFFGSPSGQRIRVALGEKFQVQLNDYGPGTITWATTNDPSLAVSQLDVNVVEIKAEATGSSEVQVQIERRVDHYITVEVFNPAEATSLGLKTQEPVNK